MEREGLSNILAPSKLKVVHMSIPGPYVVPKLPEPEYVNLINLSECENDYSQRLLGEATQVLLGTIPYLNTNSFLHSACCTISLAEDDCFKCHSTF